MKTTKCVLFGLVLAGVIGICVRQKFSMNGLVQENERLRAGLAVASAQRKETEASKPSSAGQAEIGRLQKAESEVQQLRGRLSAALAAQAEAAQSKSQLKNRPAATNADSSDTTNQFAGAMGGMMKEVMEQQFLGQLARMKSKVNLSTEQEDGIRKILLKQADQGMQMAQKMFGGGKLNKDDIANAQGNSGNPEKDIRALLTPDQQAAYTDYKQEETRGNARLAANAEMMQLQNTLGLSQEQQDQVYPILFDQMSKQLNGDFAKSLNSTDPGSIVQQQFEQKFKALEGVLTPDQAESYRRFQETQLKMVNKLMPQLGQPSLPPTPVPSEVVPKK